MAFGVRGTRDEEVILMKGNTSTHCQSSFNVRGSTIKYDKNIPRMNSSPFLNAFTISFNRTSNKFLASSNHDFGFHGFKNKQNLLSRSHNLTKLRLDFPHACKQCCPDSKISLETVCPENINDANYGKQKACRMVTVNLNGLRIRPFLLFFPNR